MSYARGTHVSTFKSRAEIEELLQKNGADRIAIATEPGAANVIFVMQERKVRFRIPLPPAADKKFTEYRPGGGYYTKERTPEAAFKLWEQACRERYRALLLTIKAKLVSVEMGVETFDEAFLAHIVMPGGETAGQKMLPTVRSAYAGGSSTLLLGPG